VEHEFGSQDFIYSAGLTDYLDKRLFKALIAKCHSHLRTGGTLLIGNFGPRNPDRTFMDHILQWKLIHREEDELQSLFKASGPWSRVDVLSEEQGVNLFVKAHK
jgi:cyclopropane fatty-acyl-phospholipid synthase-like methyltransferase